MTVSWKHLKEHGPVLKALGQTAIAVAFPKKSGEAPSVPGPTIVLRTPGPSKELVRAYVRNVGGNVGNNKNEVPAHLFPQWGFGPAGQTLAGVPYPLAKTVNGGCRFKQNAPIPIGAPLDVTAQLVSIDDNGKRAVMEQRIVTGTPDHPEALVAHLYAICPLPRPKDAPRGPKKARPTVPADAKEVAFWRINASAGLDFAKLTGDFNPIHWIPAYAKVSGFRSTILHGFGTMARAIEGLNKDVFAGGTPIRTWDCRFTRPLVLPAKVGLYVRDDADGTRRVWVGDAPGGTAYMEGSFSV
jgi:acyl dehydratase